MKLYTGTGDDGTTGLFGGQRVSKDHPRVEAYGTVDELNAAIGLAAAACDPTVALHKQLLDMFAAMQSRLFDLGADLATPPGSKHEDKIARIEEAEVRVAEQWIDEIDGGNVAMTSFVMPGGSELAARLHLARTICRRAERRMIHVIHAEGRDSIGEATVTYMNRIGDLLFAMARRANRQAGIDDVPWIPRRTI